MTRNNSAARTKLITDWYESQDEITKRGIDSIGNQLEKGIQERHRKIKSKKRKPGFGEKSKLELVYALSRFLNSAKE